MHLKNGDKEQKAASDRDFEMNSLMRTRNSSNFFLTLSAVEGLFDLYQ